MDKIKVLIYSKINLSLNILGVKDKMHIIDSVMQSVSIGDVLTAVPRLDNKIKITFTGEGAEFIDKDDNSVIKTVEYLRNIFGDFGADIAVEKNIPLAGGLGGSSADSAAALIAFNKLFDFDKRGLDLKRAAAQLSSDASFMICGGCARVGGLGEQIAMIENNLPLYIVIAHDGAKVNSRDAYLRFDTLYPKLAYAPSDNDKLIGLLNGGGTNALKHFANALEAASQSLCGSITKTKTALIGAGALSVVMTGSGGACAGFFDSSAAADSAAEALKKQGFWARSCFSTNTSYKIL